MVLLYVLSSMATRGRALASTRAASAEANPVARRKHMANVLPSALAAVLRDAELDAIVHRVREVGIPKNRLAKDDLLGGVEIFFLVSFARSPSRCPFFHRRPEGRGCGRRMALGC